MELENIIIIVVAVVFLLLLWIFVGYRNLKGLNKGIKSQWQDVLKNLNLRQNLIPILVETVKKYTEKQEDLIQKIIKQRMRAAREERPELDKIIFEHDLSNSINKLVDLGKIYGDLGKDTNFLEMRGEIDELENEIEKKVKKYNDMVRYFNKHRDSFVFLPLAVVFGFGRENIFEVEK